MKELLQTASENVSFLLVSLLVFAALVAVAKLSERLVHADLHRPTQSRYIAFVAMSAALGGILMYFEIPLFFAPSFYQLDLSEIPVLICSFYLGPVAGVITEFLKVVIKLFIKGTSTAFVGDFANFVVGCTFILPATIFYHIRKTRKMAVVGMVAGTIIMAICGSLFNALYLLPTFSVLYGMPLDAIVGMGQAVNPAINSVAMLVLLAVVPFNLLKGAVVSVVTFALYKRTERALSRVMLPQQRPARHGTVS